MTSPFDILARYWQVKAAHPAPSATPRRHVRGTFGHGPEGTIPGLAPKTWNGADFSAYWPPTPPSAAVASAASAVLVATLSLAAIARSPW